MQNYINIYQLLYCMILNYYSYLDIILVMSNRLQKILNCIYKFLFDYCITLDNYNWINIFFMSNLNLRILYYIYNFQINYHIILGYYN